MGPLRELREGVLLLAEGGRFLQRDRSLWPLACIPVLFALLFVVAASVLFWLRLGAVHGMISGWLPVLDATNWWSWLWVGPGLVLLWLLGWLAVLLAFALSLVMALLLANLASAPFLDLLSQRVERRVTGFVEQAEGGGVATFVGESLRSFGAELRRLAFLGGLWLVISLFGLVVPGAQLIAGPALVVVTVLFLPLDYCGFALDRRQVPFGERRRWLVRNGPTMLGFGGIAFVACLVPGINLLIWPAMVTAGTLLVVRREPSLGDRMGARLPPPAGGSSRRSPSSTGEGVVGQ